MKLKKIYATNLEGKNMQIKKKKEFVMAAFCQNRKPVKSQQTT